MTALDTTNNRSATASSFCALIDLLATEGMAADALKVAAFLTRFFNELGTVLPPVDKEQFNRAVKKAKRSITAQAAAAAWAKGEGMTLAQAATKGSL